MAFVKPKVKKITADISNLSIYLRSVKKFGKSTLFRDTILAKYGDPTKGLLVELRHEYGDQLMDDVYSTHIDTYKDLIELKKWLLSEKGKEHDIKIVAFDVADELVPIFEQEVVRLHNIENPKKQVKSVKAAFGGYNSGIEMAAEMIKSYMTDLKKAGFGVWVISHTRFKSVKEKGNLDEEGYQTLTSNLVNAYESAFGDIADLVLTGYIDRSIEEVGDGDSKKRYATDAIRKLYFRGTSLIDAGSRFSPEAVPEYMVFDKMNMGEDFLNIIEDGIRKSASSKPSTTPSKPKPAPVVKEEPVEEIPVEKEIDEIEEELPFEEAPIVDESDYPDDLVGEIRKMFKACKEAETKSKVKSMISENGGKLADVNEDALKKIYDVLK